MPETPVPTGDPFGIRMRRMRHEQNVSLSELARRTNYTKGYLSRVETGKQRPTSYLARLCDTALAGRGELAAAVPEQDAPQPAADQHPARALGRRDVLRFSAAAVVGIGTATGTGGAGEHGSPERFRRWFEQVRRLGQSTSPVLLLPVVEAQVRLLCDRMVQARGADRVRFGMLAARNAEYAGWMAQESGHGAAALAWTAHAVDLAASVGQHELAAYASVRRALVTMYDGNAAETVELARLAQADRQATPRVRGLAAQREAQGHALAGAQDSCLRALDRAREHLAAAEPVPGAPVLGTSFVWDPVSVVTGCCLYDLGRPAEAARVLDREVARIPVTAVRSRTRFAVHQALAHATAGDLDRACALTATLVPDADDLESYTIRCDLRALATALRRWRNHDAVRALDPALTAALSPSG